jgi:hypothetical protein
MSDSTPKINRRAVLCAAAALATRAAAQPQVPALAPAAGGRQFAILGDSTALGRGVQMDNFQAVAGVIRRLTPRPEFLVHLGDHFWGNDLNEQELRTQWRDWAEISKALGDLPTLHLTGNHTCLDAMSARVFGEMVPPLLPKNAELAADRLSFVWRDGDFVFVVANAIFRNGTEGRVDWRWVAAALARHADARFKFVASHYPVFPVNGFRPPCWRVCAEDAAPLWKTLVKHEISAYLCAHVIAFDVQIHEGIPQICSGGGGYSLLYPPQTEYHHAVQLAVDSRGLAWQAVDTSGSMREQGSWPLDCPAAKQWSVVEAKGTAIEQLSSPSPASDVLLLHFEGKGAAISSNEQTLLNGWNDSSAPAAVWVGFDGGRLEVRISPQRGEPALYWRGPDATGSFSFDIALHRSLGPGGVLFRSAEGKPWTSLATDSSKGFADIAWPKRWSVGMGHAAYDRVVGGGGRLVERDDPFLGSSLQVRVHLVRLA